MRLLARSSLFVSTLVAAALGACGDDDPTPPPMPPGPGSSSSQGGGGEGGEGGDGGDGGSEDGGGGAGGMLPCTDELAPAADPPALLKDTGLYDDVATKELAPHVERFQPRYPLWSDAAVKDRFVYLPCAPVDTSDMNDWSMPVGTRFWKEFSVGGKRIETRLIHRYGPGPTDFLMTSYQWNDQETEATRVQFGVIDANGTEHDIPSETDCQRCHGGINLGGRPSRMLGFGALQLSHAGPGLTIAGLSAAGRLTTPAPQGFDPPGDAVSQEALGYFHGNCGQCHNDSVDGLPSPPLYFWLDVAATTVEQTSAYASTVGVAPTGFGNPGCSLLIAPGDAADSCVPLRMDTRAVGIAMPPLGTEQVDTTGVAAVTAWINSL